MVELALPSGLRPIIVDDNRSVLMLARMNLKGYGVTPTEFSDSQAALEYILSLRNTFDPKRDLLITDYDVPPLSGPILVKRVKESLSDFPVIAVSARFPEEIEEEWPGLFNKKIKKPYSPRELVATIADLMR